MQALFANTHMSPASSLELLFSARGRPSATPRTIGEAPRDKTELRTLFHFGDEAERAQTAETVVEPTPDRNKRSGVALPALPQHSSAQALARALRNRLAREKQKDQQKRGAMLRHLRHELFSSTHGNNEMQ